MAKKNKNRYDKVDLKTIVMSGIILSFIAFGIYAMLNNMMNTSNNLANDDKGVENVEELANMGGEEYLNKSREGLKKDSNYKYTVDFLDYKDKVMNTDELYVYYYSPVCSHCLTESPVIIEGLENAKRKNGKDFEFIQVDTTVDSEFYWNETGLEGTPTLVKYEKGVEVGRSVGSGSPKIFYSDFFDNSSDIDGILDVSQKGTDISKKLAELDK